MEAIGARAEELTRRGSSLAERGALYSARAEFIQALRLIAQSLDAQTGRQDHGRALAAGLRALKEADDFAPQGSQLDAELDVGRIVAGHRTPVLKVTAASGHTPLTALQCYYSFAQDRLAAACGGHPAGSAALYGLAKLQIALAGAADHEDTMYGPKAMTLHRAALLVNPQHHMAANELGVLLARYGQLQLARHALLQSIGARPRAETWHNLSVVHERLGEIQLAQQARREAELANRRTRDRRAAAHMSQVGALIRWVDAAEFDGAPRR
jgi:tetratricopeptide (TPR) repeat protein